MALLKRVSALLIVFFALGCCGSAAAASIPDPLALGSHSVTKVEYYGGSVMMSAPSSSGAATAAFQHPLDGALFYPSGPGAFDVVILLHGNHSDCLTALGTETTTSGANCATAAPGYVPLLNYEGYDYLAQNLASQGFIVLSLDADALTSYQTSTDSGTYLREQLLSASLDMLYNWEDGAPLYVQTNPGQIQTSPTLYASPYALAGKIALENGVGLWGHSRGGEGVTDFIEYNRTRPSPGRKYKLDAVMAWAPVDYIRASVYGTATNGTTPAATAYADVLPLCDGDVSNLHGARDYMNSLYPTAEPNDPSPKLQFAFQGGDHDYSNTVWASSTSDDGLGYASTNLTGTTRADAACGEDEPDNIRLTPQDQQNLTTALTGAFMRRYAQGDMAFDPLMTGAATLPADATGQSRGVVPAEELKTTYWAPASQRLNVLKPTPGNLTSDALGGSLSGTGFQNPYQSQYCVNGTCEAAGVAVPTTTAEGYDWCDPEPVDFKVSSGFPTAAKSCPLPPSGTSGVYDPVAFGGQANEREGHPVNRSWGPQLSLAWDGDAQLNLEIPAANQNVSNYKVLAMDAAVNYFDSRNPASGPNNPAAETDPRAAVQNFVVQLTDAHGKTAQVQANKLTYGTALEAPLGSSRRQELLNEIRIPVTDFSGVDLTQIRKISLIFGTTTVSGSIQLANMRFQETVDAATTDPVIGTAPSTSPQAGNKVASDAIPLNGVEAVTSKAVCADRTAPTSKLTKLRLRGGRLTVSGRASDVGCRASGARRARAGSVMRVIVTLQQAHAGGCRFLLATGKLGTTVACRYTYSLIAKGTRNFSISTKAKLPAGTYTLIVQAIDSSGNLEKQRVVKVRVSHGKIAEVRS